MIIIEIHIYIHQDKLDFMLNLIVCFDTHYPINKDQVKISLKLRFNLIYVLLKYLLCLTGLHNKACQISLFH